MLTKSVMAHEAFSAGSLPLAKGLKCLGRADEKMNINGSAIALGHPPGCAGARREKPQTMTIAIPNSIFGF